MNLYQKRVYKKSLQHGMKWKNHKYLYIDANGNYVYPSDVVKKAGNKARDLNAQGQAINVNMRKERAEKIKAGNDRMANSKPAQLAKAYLKNSKVGKILEPANDVNRWAKSKDFSKVLKGNKVKPKTQEELDKEREQLDKEMNDLFTEFAQQQMEGYAKEYAQQEIKKKKKKGQKLISTVSHSDTYRSNAMNLYKRKIYKSQLQHGLEWKRHKYLYKDANGNYVYPEDVKNNAKSKVQGFIADQKQKSKDRKFVKDIPKYREKEAINARKYGGPGSAHQGAMHEHYWDHGGLDHTTPAEGAKSLEKQKQKTKQRKEEEAANKAFLAERKKIDQQRKSAHAGYEADKKNFPDGGSTEELERQKAKTHARKRLKGDALNQFRKDPAIDNDPEVRAARKKWVGKEEDDGRNTVTAGSAAGRSINAHKMYDSVNRTPHEGAKRKASWEKYFAGQKSGDARREYLAARQRAAEKDYLTQTRKARETKARTEDTVERMRKKKKRSSR